MPKCQQIIFQQSKWLSWPSHKSTWELRGEEQPIEDKWDTDLSHPLISIYPDGELKTTKSLGMLSWRS